MKPLLLVLATAADLTGTTNYIWNIVKGSTRPHRTTRLMLFLVAAVNMIGAVSAHARAGTLILSALFLARGLTLFVLSIKKGIGGTSAIDIVCGIIALLGIVVWKLSGSGVTALVFAIIADAVAYVPAVIKTWSKPETESPLLYWLGGVATLFAVIHDGFVLSTIFQVYIAFSCVVMLLLIYQDKVKNIWLFKPKEEPPL